MIEQQQLDNFYRQVAFIIRRLLKNTQQTGAYHD